MSKEAIILAKSAVPTVLSKINILLLGSSSHATKFLSNTLESLGFSNIEIAHDGYDGISIMKKKKIHLLFTDSDLRLRKRAIAQPSADDLDSDSEIIQLNGTEFVKRLRQSPQSPNPKAAVFVIVNENENKNIEEARNVGVNDVIIKPFQAQSLVHHIISIIDDKRLLITTPSYKGPCRRRSPSHLTQGLSERRFHIIKVKNSLRPVQTKGHHDGQ